MRCSLGDRKIKRVEEILGCKVKSAFVRGGETHYWAAVTTIDGRHPRVNYKTGRVVWDVDQSLLEPQKAFDAVWRSGGSELEAKLAAQEAEFRIWGS